MTFLFLYQPSDIKERNNIYTLGKDQCCVWTQFLCAYQGAVGSGTWRCRIHFCDRTGQPSWRWHCHSLCLSSGGSCKCTGTDQGHLSVRGTWISDSPYLDYYGIFDVTLKKIFLFWFWKLSFILESVYWHWSCGGSLLTHPKEEGAFLTLRSLMTPTLQHWGYETMHVTDILFPGEGYEKLCLDMMANIPGVWAEESLSHLHVEFGEGKESWGMLRVMLQGLLVQLDGSFVLPLVGCVLCHLRAHAEGRKVLLTMWYATGVVLYVIILYTIFT